MTRQITIVPVLNGYLCSVGCQSVVFTDKQTMLTALSEYYDNPEQVEERYQKRAINRVPGAPVDPPAQCVAEAQTVGTVGGIAEAPPRERRSIR